MKKICLFLLVFVLSACVNSPAKPTEPPATKAEQATAVPAPTDTSAPAEVSPTETPLPDATETTAPADASSTEPAAGAAGETEFGDMVFTSKSGATVAGKGGYSAAAFSYQCDSAANQVVVTINISDPNIYKVNYVFRMTAVDTPTISTGWSGDSKMDVLGGGKFQLTFPASQVPAKARTWKAWLDFQFIAFDNADVTYTSPAFAKLITYTYKCP